MAELALNSQAPDFTLPDQDGVSRTLADYHGRWVVLYFYPKDDTPGCTKEACNFRDSFHELTKLGVAVLGVSKDSVRSHQKFAAKYNLTFPLLSDPDHVVIAQYGAWAPKKFMGREFLGTLRMTYLISPEGRVAKVYPQVNPTQHVLDILADLRDLQGQALQAA